MTNRADEHPPAR